MKQIEEEGSESDEGSGKRRKSVSILEQALMYHSKDQRGASIDEKAAYTPRRKSTEIERNVSNSVY